MRGWWLAALALAACNGRIDAPFGQALPGRDDVRVTEYRAHVSGGLSDPVQLDFDAGTTAALLELEGARGEYHLAEWVSPRGDDLVESGGFVTRDAREVPGLVDWLYPNTPALALEPGSWRLRFTALDGTTPVDGDVTVRVYGHQQVRAAARISLDLVVAEGALGGADVDQTTSRIVAEVARLYAQVNVQIGDYTVRRVQLDRAEIALDGTESTVVAQALSGARAGAVHLVLVGAIQELGGVVGGYALGLPGPVEADRPTAAVLVAAGPFASPSDGTLDLPGLAVTCAHEIGHYLGLYHTSERDGRQHDPIPDTPECSGAGPCDGASNIMFWTGGATRDRLSDGQGQVMRSHPLAAPADTAPPRPMCELACDPPRTCAILGGESTCAIACDPGDPQPCDNGAGCRPSDDGVYVCGP